MKCPKCSLIQTAANTKCTGCGVHFAAVSTKPARRKSPSNPFILVMSASACLGLVLYFGFSANKSSHSATEQNDSAAHASDVALIRAKAIDTMRNGPVPMSGGDVVGALTNAHVKDLCVRNMLRDKKSDEEIRERCL